MTKGHHTVFSTVLAAVFGAAMAAALPGDAGFGVSFAQTADEKKKKEQEKQKAAPAKPQPPPPPRATPQPRVTAPPTPSVPQQKQLPPSEKPSFRSQQPPEKPAFQKTLPPPEGPVQRFQQPSEKPPEKPAFQKALPPPEGPVQRFQQPSEKPAFQKTLPPSEGPAKQFQQPSQPPRPLQATPPAELKRLPPPSDKDAAQPKGQPPGFGKAPSLIAKPPGGAGGPVIVKPRPQPSPQLQLKAFKRFDDLKKDRVERVEEGGRRKVIKEGNRFIIKERNRTVIRHDYAQHLLRRPGARSERRPDGSVETFYLRRDGTRVITVVDSHGRLLRRYRRDRDGREYNIIDNRRFYRNVAIGVVGIIALSLALPRVTIPEEEYFVDYEGVSDDALYDTLYAPPIERLDRAYSLEEVLDNYELRAHVRSINIDTIDFEFGSWEISRDQYDKLERIARAIRRVLRNNPDALLLIEAYSTELGNEDNDISLAQSRADVIANVLADEFDIPPENLVAQGYGEQEPRNRDLVIRNITGLMAER